MGPNTRVLATGWLSTIKTLVRTILPELVTVPVKTSVPPGVTGWGGQDLVSAIPGEVVMGQLELALFVTATPQMLLARTVEVLMA
jgi:hypothetical protein